MRIRLVSIPVSNQQKAFEFYSKVLGFQVKHDIPLGGENRWLTLVSKDEPDGAEILLEPAPLHFEPSKVYQKACYDAGMPITQFDVDNVQQEYERLTQLGVEFTVTPKDVGTAVIAILKDTCDNLIQLIELK